MNCPKCGEDLDTGLNCYKCGYLDIKKIEFEPTIAEKLLWLAENESIDIWHTASKEIVSVWRNGEEYKFIFKTLVEAINAAYEWAKEEV